jgi:hypothetical protein
MNVLWRQYPDLPFRAVAPWPLVVTPNSLQLDWVDSVIIVESWLDQHVGDHYVDWCWNMWTLHQYNYCGVAFRYEPNVSLFLLRFGS